MTARLDAIRAALAQSFDDYGEFAVTSAGLSTVTIANISTTQATASTEAYNEAWVFALATGAASGQQRRVNTNGYTGATGALQLNVNWSLIPSVNDPVKITRLLPCTQQTGQPHTSYLTCMNRGLGKLLVRDRVPLAITTSESYALTTWAAWLDRPERLLRVYEPSPTGGARTVPCDWRTPRLVPDAGGPTLELDAPFSTASGNLILEVLRPANSNVAVAGVWAESTVGLVNESDVVDVSLEEAVMVARVEVFRVLMTRRDGERPRIDLDAAYETALQAARELPLYEFGMRAQPQQQEAA